MTRPEPEQILPGIWRFQESCNVYVVQHQGRALAIDFGLGEWLAALPDLGIRHLEHVFLTHHHADQCQGLQKEPTWDFTIHAPAGEERFLEPENAQLRLSDDEYLMRGCPESYSVLAGGVANVRYDVLPGQAWCGDLYWGNERIRFLRTPGHGPYAVSVIIDVDGQQIVFSGDAIHKGATIWQPYHLEWDHYTGSGALAAWEGINRLRGVAIDLLCPAHGPVIAQEPHQELGLLADRLLAFYHAKGAISPQEYDCYVRPEILACGARQILPHLYQFGANGYLLRSRTNEGLIVDPFSGDIEAMERLLVELKEVKPTAAVSSHYHADHSDGMPYLQERYDAKAWLHPWIAHPLQSPRSIRAPWQPIEPVVPDALWPEEGTWKWNEYLFQVAPWPGQTWWHCVFMAEVDDQRVAFGGDSFQPASRWQGTGGFCAYNRSRFREGYIPSAELMLSWKPDIVACGHGTFYQYRATKFQKIIEWAKMAEKATAALCPTGDLETDYYHWSLA
jgi:glyoxylase-like metal-dependent hydrolase (beta-lactamase superfamily II)